MALITLMSPVTRDGRTMIAINEYTVAADAAYESGYYWSLSGQTSLDSRPLTAKTLAIGESLWFRFEWAATAWSSLTSGTKYRVATISLLADTGNPKLQFSIDGNTAASPNVELRFYDANGNNTASASSYTYNLSRKSFLMLITKDSSTQVTCKLYEGTTEKMTLTHTAAGGVGTLTFGSFWAGFLDAVPKGATVATRVGNLKVHDSTGSGLLAAAPTTTSRIQSNASNVGIETGSQPTGVPEEAEWRNTADSATAAVTEVDDVWGTAIATRDDDYNQTTSTTAAKTQSYSFPTSSLGLSAGDLPETNVNAANFKLRKKATGGAVNIIAYSVWRLLYYEPSDRIMAVAFGSDLLGISTTGQLEMVFDDGTEAALEAYDANGGSAAQVIFRQRFWTALPSGVPASARRIIIFGEL